MIRKAFNGLLIVLFFVSNSQPVAAEVFSINALPLPGLRVALSAPFTPVSLKGLIVDPQKPLEFKFLLDNQGQAADSPALKEEANRLTRYFLTGLTIPKGDLWVNLSPYEKDRIIPVALGQTELGRDLLAQDYLLKQLTASLIYPDSNLGAEFWARVYKQARQKYGATQIPINTFNKVWIVPNETQVYEKGNAVYVTKSTLKVMLEEDYLAMSKVEGLPAQRATQRAGDPEAEPLSARSDNEDGRGAAGAGPAHVASQVQISNLTQSIIKEIVIPVLEQEINEGKHFGPLRQIFQTLILAQWYKETVSNGLLDAVYTNKKKIAGVNLEDNTLKDRIYDRYLQAYKKGSFNFVQEESGVPRKYFSGGIVLDKVLTSHSNVLKADEAMITRMDVVIAVGSRANFIYENVITTWPFVVVVVAAVVGGGYFYLLPKLQDRLQLRKINKRIKNLALMYQTASEQQKVEIDQLLIKTIRNKMDLVIPPEEEEAFSSINGEFREVVNGEYVSRRKLAIDSAVEKALVIARGYGGVNIRYIRADNLSLVSLIHVSAPREGMPLFFNASKAMISPLGINGGIDLNQINIKRTGTRILMKVDPAQLSIFMNSDFEGFTPRITQMSPVSNPAVLMNN